jgi:endonuclease-3 related protein
VGPETADSILLYAFGVPVFMIDAYTRRIFSRLGLVSATQAYEELREGFEAALEPDYRLYQEYHALIVRHAKEFCRSLLSAQDVHSLQPAKAG